jgi:hypothetical protein
MVIGTVLVPVLLILGVVSNAWMPSWGAASVAIVFGLGACFLLVRKIGSGGRRASAVIFALGSGLGVVSAVGQADRARWQKLDEPTTAATWMPLEAPVKAAPVGEAAPEPASPEMRARDARLQCMAIAQDNFSGVDWKGFKNISSRVSEPDVDVNIEGETHERSYILACKVHPLNENEEAFSHGLYRFDRKSKKTVEEVNVPPPCPQGFTATSVCKAALKEPLEPVDEKARAMGARATCVSETQDNYPGVDWKFFHNIATKPATDHVEVTIEGQRESQAYRVVCRSFDGDEPTTHILYRVDAKSTKMSVETKALEPCTTGWTAKSVCRLARPASAPVVPPGKRLDAAADQCRDVARSKYPGIEWRTIMGISSDWFELGGIHGARTSIQGTRNGQSLNITCFLPDGASESVHELSTL